MDDLDYALPAHADHVYYDTWDRHNSIAFNTTKGLRNAPGENNCFVNSAVQVLWHLDVFRRSYRRLNGHTCMGNSCIFCALKVIFTQFQYSDQASFAPDALRKALADAFAKQDRFQLGHMDDAAECFENILRRIHYHVAGSCKEDTCQAPHCLPHQKFAMTVQDQIVCPCGASSTPLTFHEMVHYISASALVSQAEKMRETGDELHPDRFGLLLRNAGAMGDVRDCPGGCGRKVQLRKTLMNSPDVVSVGLVWDSDHPSLEMTTAVNKTIGTTMLLPDVFHRVMKDTRTLPKLQLAALVCYYGKHYSTFVFHSKFKVWYYFDDSNVREVGPRWEFVVDKCVRGRYQPLLLIYSNSHAAPIPVDTAPKKRVMAPGYAPATGVDEVDGSSLDRTQESLASAHQMLGGATPASAPRRSRTPNPSELLQAPSDLGANGRRAVTPNPADLAELQKRGSGSSEHRRQPSFLIAMADKPALIQRINGNTNSSHHHPSLGGGSAEPMSHGSSVSSMNSSMGPGQQFSGPPPPGAMKQGFDQMAANGTADAANYDNYTLSASDCYRRPSLNGVDGSKVALTQSMLKAPDAQRKESFKKGKVKVPADVIRYHAPTSSNSSSPSPDAAVPSHGDYVTMTTSTRPGLNPSIPPRARLHSAEGVEGSSMETVGSSQQHCVVKPTVSSSSSSLAGMHNYENIEALGGHTAVQSGLATLPRRKNNASSESLNSAVAHQRQGSQENGSLKRQASMGNLLRPEDSMPDSVSLSAWTGLPQQQGDVTSSQRPTTPRGHQSGGQHERQTSGSGKESRPRKKAGEKGEKKRKEKKAKTPESPDSASYIDPRMVETILKHQGLQRQVSTRSTSSQQSSSSLDSDGPGGVLGRLRAGKGGEALTVDIPFDNVSLGSHKDSGYGSSDRNSASSTGSGTVDPYTQYFLSRSMIVPKSVNPQALQERLSGSGQGSNFQCYNAAGESYPDSADSGRPAAGPSPSSGPPGGSEGKTEVRGALYEALHGRRSMHPIKESSYEDRLKEGPAPKSDPAPSHPGSNKAGPAIPPKTLPLQQAAQHSRPGGPEMEFDQEARRQEQFGVLCQRAEEFMDQCMLAETSGELELALHFCDSATGVLKQAISLPDIPHQSVVFAQKKHNSCLLKSRSLSKKQQDPAFKSDAGLPGKRASVTSSDSDGTYTDSSRSRRSGSRESLDSVKHVSPISSSPSSSDLKHSASLPANLASSLHQRQHSGTGSDSSRTLARTISDHGVKDHAGSSHGRSDSNSSSRSGLSQTSAHTEGGQDSSGGNTGDSYGTLPRRHQSRKPSDSSTSQRDAEVYQAFLSKQKSLQQNLQVHHARSSSGSSATNSLDGRDSDGSSERGHSKMNKQEIRQLLHQNMLQRQQGQQTPAPMHPGSSSGGSRPQQHHQQQRSGSLSPHPGDRGGTGMTRQGVQHGSAPHHRHPGPEGGLSHPPPSQPHPHHHHHHHHHHGNLPPNGGQPHSTSGYLPPHPARTTGVMSPPHPPPNDRVPPPYPAGEGPPPYSQVQRNPAAADPHPYEPRTPDRQGPASSSSSSVSGPPREVGRGQHAPVGPQAPHSRPKPAPPPRRDSCLSTPGVEPGPSPRQGVGPPGAPPGVPPKPADRPAPPPASQKPRDPTYANQSDTRTSNNFRGTNSSFPTFPGYAEQWGKQGQQPQQQQQQAHPPTDPSRPRSPHHPSAPHPAGVDAEDDQSNINVKALASRFENVLIVTSDPHKAPPPSRRAGSESPPRTQLQRVRSKSESREPPSEQKQRPKSVLKKAKKNTRHHNRPRKSVTFCDNIDLIAAAGLFIQGSETELEARRKEAEERAYYSDDEDRRGQHRLAAYDVEDDSSGSSESPLPGASDEACQLCQKKTVALGQQYCGKCMVYMSRFMPTR